MHATAQYRAGRLLASRAIAWSSADPARATGTTAGLVTGVSAGSASITATSGRVAAAVQVAVLGEPGAVASVSVAPAVSRMVVGQTLQLTALMPDASGAVLSGRPVVWQPSASKRTGVATLSAEGLIASLAAGQLVVEAVSEGQRGILTIDVAEDVDEGIVVSIAEPVADTRGSIGVAPVVFMRGPRTGEGGTKTPPKNK